MGDIRANYLQRMTELYRKKTSNSVLMDRQEYHARLERLMALENPSIHKTAADYRILRTSEVSMQADVNGIQTPKLIKRNTNLLYLPIEEMYDTIHSAHIQLKHAGRNRIQRFFRNRYCNITKDCIMAYLSTCQNCPRRKRPNGLPNCNRSRNSDVDLEDDEDDFDDENEHKDLYGQHSSDQSESTEKDSKANGGRQNAPNPVFMNAPIRSVEATVVSTTPLSMNFLPHSVSGKKKQLRVGGDESFSRGQIDLLDMQKQPDGEYRWILHYMNLTTREVRLRPLRSGTSRETADILVDIYSEQGAPVVLQSLINGRGFAEEVVREVSKIWPQCKQLHSFVKSGPSAERIENVLLSQLSNMMKRHETNSWAGMLRYLQWEFNTTYNSELDRTPIECAFGRKPTLGLKSSKLLDAIYEKAQSEEEILEYLQDAELLRLSAFCSTTVSQQPNEHNIGHPSKRARILGLNTARHSPPQTSANNSVHQYMDNIQNLTLPTTSASLNPGNLLPFHQQSSNMATNIGSAPNLSNTPQHDLLQQTGPASQCTSRKQSAVGVEHLGQDQMSHQQQHIGGMHQTIPGHTMSNTQTTFLEYVDQSAGNVGQPRNPMGQHTGGAEMNHHDPMMGQGNLPQSQQTAVTYIHQGNSNALDVYSAMIGSMNTGQQGMSQQNPQQHLEMNNPGNTTSSSIKSEMLELAAAQQQQQANMAQQPSPNCGVNPNGRIAMEEDVFKNTKCIGKA
ncbi:KRAB-A domain-containing protein 2 [Ditylenchus destructor]|nr:KRAB-A domain-containing protein 2 [Ditylenchus destructor]